jgi:hypothetical protein
MVDSTFMRAPSESVATLALQCAVDELASDSTQLNRIMVAAVFDRFPT